jgi:hypothetical protein
VASVSFSQLLTLVSWFLLGALIFFTILIARSYERFSGDKTYFRAFLLPLVCFGIGAVRYASIDHINGDWVANSAYGVGGVALFVLSLLLMRRMLRNRVVDEA